jgi:hypothetical protein
MPLSKLRLVVFFFCSCRTFASAAAELLPPAAVGGAASLELGDCCHLAAKELLPPAAGGLLPLAAAGLLPLAAVGLLPFTAAGLLPLAAVELLPLAAAGLLPTCSCDTVVPKIVQRQDSLIHFAERKCRSEAVRQLLPLFPVNHMEFLSSS